MRSSYRCGLAAVVSLALLAPVSATASAVPVAPPPSTVSVSASSEQRVNVVVLLKNQPAAPSQGQERTNVADQDTLLAAWSDQYGLSVERQFGYLVNGFSASMPAGRMLALAQEPTVASVKIERVYDHVETGAAPDLADAESLELTPSQHSARVAQGVPTALKDYGTDGTGTVVAIIDSGIDPEHQDMRLDSSARDKVKITTVNPAAEGHFNEKVPTGYNYADESYVVKDATKDQHGMHVAGIVAANGSLDGESAEQAWAKGRLDGVAPNAQLLAMKVFSNSGGGARDADIIAAIEDSVKLGADVLNLSLGSPNGLNDTSDGTYRALAKARQAGAIVDIAAGNAGLNFSSDESTSDLLGVLDDATLGSPSSNADAFTIASIENTTVTQPQAYGIIDGTEQGMLYSLQTGTADGQNHPLVDVGLGRAEDYTEGQDLAGAYALVERGEISFADKFSNAVEHGAGGVLVFNSAAGGDELLSMAGIDSYTLPGGSVPRSSALELRQAIQDGKTVQVRLTSEVLVSGNEKALTPSSFTSWGPTPSLDFKPQLAGIGGEVYSTLNDNRYGTKSGTSMATPNVSGMASLMVEEYAERFPSLSAAQRAELIRVALMNTARVPADEQGVPYAPRQVGAGLAQVDKALATGVYATVEDQPDQAAVALRQVDGPRSFTVTLTNRSDKDVSYTVPAQKVVGESNEAGAQTTTHVSSESLVADVSAVTVPAGGTATLTFTLTPDTSSTHYVEGWASLVSATDGAPDLSVPYLGLVGDWNAEAIVRAPGDPLPASYDPNASTTGLVATWGGLTVPLSSALGDYAVSPNGDGDMDVVAPSLVLMRNASDAEYEVVDSSGQVLKVIGQEQGLRRSTGSEVAVAEEPSAYVATTQTFDGTVWDPAAAEHVRVPDGEYTFRVRTRLSPDYPWQTVEMPFTVDATAPVLTFGTLQDGLLPITVTETGSGLLGTPTVTGPDGKDLTVTETGGNTFTAEVPQGTPYVTASVVDRGFNLAVATAILAPGTHLVVPDAQSLSSSVVGTASPLVSDGQLHLQAFVSSDVDHLTVAGKDVEVADGRANAFVPLAEGAQEIEVVAYGADGTVLQTLTIPVTYDSQAPVLTVTGVLDEDGALALAQDGTVTVTGSVSDERAGATLSVTVAGKEVEVGPDGTFSTTFTPAEDLVAVPVVASDGANTTSQSLPIAGRGQGTEPAFTAPSFNGSCQRLTACFVSSSDAGATATSYTLSGSMGDASVIRLTPASRFGEDGSPVNPLPLEARGRGDGTFSLDLPTQPGINQFRLEVLDAEGKVVPGYDHAFFLYLDVAMPTLSFTTPTLYDGVLYTRDSSVTFAGSAEDDGWGYKLGINDSSVVEVYNGSGTGPESNKREFSRDVAVADGDILLIEASDSMGNTLAGGIPVVVDAQAPDATIQTVREGETVSDKRVLTVSATDQHLATAQVTVDGQVVDTLSTDAASKAGTVQGVLAPAGQDAQAQARNEADQDGQEVAAAAPAVLTTQVATADLALGRHTVSVTARDLAGNETTRTISFVVDLPAQIEGADSLSLTVNRADLGDQELLAAKVLSAYRATDDGAVLADGSVAGASATALSLAAGTVLTEGRQQVTVVATDAAGRTVTRTVTVTIDLEILTLRDGKVTATGSFRRDDALSATLTEDRLVVSNREGLAPVDAVITVPVVEGTSVWHLLADGRQVPVSATWADGVLTFSGPSRATYLLVAPKASDQSGTGTSGSRTDGQQGEAAPGVSSVSPTGGSSSRAGGALSRTGADSAPLVLTSAMVLAAGVLLAARRRRRA
ncbi:S8 family serine peptidase [Actinomyces faecalis]|uniref:S8 family serine peptidase n=1 Tax=Actinomyces faecalis TaxID=2722820 RepID=UPI0015572CCC|nr:S8 family serine peptidase [Actinomyces faecalis]